MNPHYTYLLIDVLTVLFPFLLSFDKKVAFYRLWQFLWLGLLLTGLFFIAWDAWFTRQGIWWFNNEYITGPRIGGLPVEECLFFLVVPYSCVFLYECLRVYGSFLLYRDCGWYLLLPLSGALLLVAALAGGRAYTISALGLCGFAGVVLFLLRRHFTAFRADLFLCSYLVGLLPFFLVNGLLTSLPVVWYNNAEYLGIRLFTIPLEDIFYGMLLVLCNVAGLEWMRQRHRKH